MGWWEERRAWQTITIAQMGAGAVLAGGVFFIQFRSAGISARPVFVLTAVGAGFGGSIGSAVSIPYAEIVRDLRNPRRQSQLDQIMWSDAGTFEMGRLNMGFGNVASVGGSAVVIGAQLTALRGEDQSGNRLFSTHTSLSSLNDILNLPGAQGGFGAGAFAMRGRMIHLP